MILKGMRKPMVHDYRWLRRMIQFKEKSQKQV